MVIGENDQRIEASKDRGGAAAAIELEQLPRLRMSTPGAVRMLRLPVDTLTVGRRGRQ